MPIVYGLKNCDTCRRAAAALAGTGREVTFRDIRAKRLDDATLGRFLAAFGDALINRRSTTWRGLSQSERAAPDATLLAAYPTLMKRPVIEDGDILTLGWDTTVAARHLG